jgi:isopenicillin-N epimerase
MPAPLLSHGSQPGSSFQERYRWQGTREPCGFLALPVAIEFMQQPEWDTERQRCHELARRARSEIGELFGFEPLIPDSPSWFEQMVSVHVPRCDGPAARKRMLLEHSVDVPIVDWNGTSLARVSCNAYNTDDDIDRLVEALRALFATSH